MSKAVESPRSIEAVAVLRAIVPPRDEHLEPWDSIVHWTELRLKRDNGKNRIYTKWIVPVTCGRRASPDCRGKHDVMVLRGMNGTETLTPGCLTGKKSTYSSVCTPCLKVKEFPLLSLGSYVSIGDDNEDGTLVKCGKCKKTRRCRIKEPKKFTGLCTNCWKRAALGSETIGEGPNKGKIPFKCSNCGKESFAWPHQHKLLTWKRLCPDCQTHNGVSLVGGLNKVAEDDFLPSTQAPVYLSRRKGLTGNQLKHVDVQCVFPVPQNENKICGKETPFLFKALRRNWDDATGFCPDHTTSGRVKGKEGFRRIQSLLEQVAQAPNGNGQKHGDVAKKKLREQEKEVKFNLILDVICGLWDRNELLGEVTYEAIARKLQDEDSNRRAWDISAKGVAKWLERYGYAGHREDVVKQLLQLRGKS